MSHEKETRQNTSAQLKSASPESQGKTMSPPAFQLKASDAPVQRQPAADSGEVSQQMSMGEIVSGVGEAISNVGSWIANLFNPQQKDANGATGGEGATTTTQSGATEGSVAAEQSQQEQELTQEVTTAEPEAPEQTREERVAELLQAYYDGFSAISVNIPNPDPAAEERTLPCQVRPPYMINTTTRRTNAEANRAANTRVNRIINTFPWGFRHGKASASQIQSFLQQCIDANLTTDNTSVGLRTFLDNFGIGVDCSGFTSQGYNSLIADMGLDHANMDVNNTGSGSFRDSSASFTAVASPSDLKPGDAMFLENGTIDHIRLIQNVTVTETGVDFVTIESRGGQGPDQRHWRFTSQDEFTGLQRSTDGGVTYAASTENCEFNRFDALYPAEEEAAETETQE